MLEDVTDYPMAPGGMTALVDSAERLIEQGQFGAAIVVLQAAVEMHVRNAFTALIAQQLIKPVAPVLDLVPDHSFMDARTRRLWTALTGDSLTSDKPVWRAYQGHVQVRNQVAHGGALGSEEWARESRTAVHAFIAHINRVMKDRWG